MDNDGGFGVTKWGDVKTGASAGLLDDATVGRPKISSSKLAV